MVKKISGAGARWLEEKTEILHQQGRALTAFEQALRTLDTALTDAVSAYRDVLDLKISKTQICDVIDASSQSQGALFWLLRNARHYREDHVDSDDAAHEDTDSAGHIHDSIEVFENASDEYSGRSDTDSYEQ